MRPIGKRSTSSLLRTNHPLVQLVERPDFQSFLILCVLTSVFLPEFWIIGNVRDTFDYVLDIILLIIFIIFTTEIVILSVHKAEYFGGPYFWIDSIGTACILLYISWILEFFLDNPTNYVEVSSVRTTRVARLALSMLRYFNCVNIYSGGQRNLKHSRTSSHTIFSLEGSQLQQSAIRKISRQLNTDLMFGVTVLVSILMIVIPLLQTNVRDLSPQTWVDNISGILNNKTYIAESTLDIYGNKMIEFYRPKKERLLYLTVDSPWLSTAYSRKFTSDQVHRRNNLITYSSSYTVYDITYPVYIGFDVTRTQQSDAVYAVIVLILVIFVLFVFTFSIVNVVDIMVVQPLDVILSSLRGNVKIMIQSMKAIVKSQQGLSMRGYSLRDKDDQLNNAISQFSLSYSNNDDEEEEIDMLESETETAMLEGLVVRMAHLINCLVTKPEIEDQAFDRNTVVWIRQLSSPHVRSGSIVSRGATIESVLDTHSPHSGITISLRNIYLTITKSGTTSSRENEKTIEREDNHHMLLMDFIHASGVPSVYHLHTWDFNILDYSYTQIYDILVFFYSALRLADTFDISISRMKRFFMAIAGRYLENPYHHFRHGCDVCHTSYLIIQLTHLDENFSSIELISILTAAVAHDVGHLGVNNLYLVKSKDKLALMHNDISPLENMHCNVLYDILHKEATNIFINFSDQQWTEARIMILTAILGTDMSNHFKQVGQLQIFLDTHGPDAHAFCSAEKNFIDFFANDEHRLFIGEMILHCSDVSNPAKPFEKFLKWTDMVIAEFCNQGDLEKDQGLEISPMCDRTQINVCNMQMGFIEFVVAPLQIAFVKLFPPLYEFGDNLLNNFQQWGERRKAELLSQGIEDGDPMNTSKEEIKKLEERIIKFQEKMEFLKPLKVLPTRPSKIHRLTEDPYVGFSPHDV